MKKILYFSAIIFILASMVYIASGMIPKSTPHMSGPHVIINGRTIRVMIADDRDEQMRGLSSQPDLCQDCGMLFVFPQKQESSFWMRNMLFPLDIVWIADDKIVKIDKNLPPEGESPQTTYSAGAPINYVLEVYGGYTDAYNISVGAKVDISL